MTSAASNKHPFMRVYFPDSDKIDSVSDSGNGSDDEGFISVPTHVKVGFAVASISKKVSHGQPAQDREWREVGVPAADEESQVFFREIVSRIQDLSIRFVPCAESPNVYFVHEASTSEMQLSQAALTDKFHRDKKLDEQPIGIFKAGSVRAQKEMLARTVAHFFGLEKCFAPGFFLPTIEPYMLLGGEEGFEEELWGDSNLIHLGEKKDEKAPSFMTGIMEPYLPSTKTTLLDRAKMIIAALVVGLRDGKPSNFCGSRIIDSEENFPPRLDPENGEPVAPSGVAYPATQLPILDAEVHYLQLAMQVFDGFKGDLAREVESIKKPVAEFLKDERKQFPVGLQTYLRRLKDQLNQVSIPDELFLEIQSNIFIDSDTTTTDILLKLLGRQSIGKEVIPNLVIMELKQLFIKTPGEFEAFLRSDELEILYRDEDLDGIDVEGALEENESDGPNFEGESDESSSFDADNDLFDASSEEEFSFENTILDVTEGNMRVRVFPKSRNDPFVPPNYGNKMLDDRQIQATLERFGRLKGYLDSIEANQQVKIEDLVFAVDPHYGEQVELKASEGGRSSTSPHTAASLSPGLLSLSSISFTSSNSPSQGLTEPPSRRSGVVTPVSTGSSSRGRSESDGSKA